MVTLHQADTSSAPALLHAIRRELTGTGFDYTLPDLVMPHPFYAPMHWVCVVNPGERSRGRPADLMDAAHALVARARYRAHGQANRAEPGD